MSEPPLLDSATVAGVPLGPGLFVLVERRQRSDPLPLMYALSMSRDVMYRPAEIEAWVVKVVPGGFIERIERIHPNVFVTGLTKDGWSVEGRGQEWTLRKIVPDEAPQR